MATQNLRAIHGLAHSQRTQAVEPLRKRGAEYRRDVLGDDNARTVARQIDQYILDGLGTAR
jgi:hypothetical protein